MWQQQLLLLSIACAFPSTSQFNSSVDWSFPLKVAFFDFDKTLTATSIGESVLTMCDPQCLNYSALSCACSAPDALPSYIMNMTNNTVLARGPSGFNGEDRIARTLQMFLNLKNLGVEVRILSTSWGLIQSDDWAKFVYQFCFLGSLGDVFPVEKIISLADPGEGLNADKGKAAAEFLASHGWTQHEGVLLDDSPTNILSAQNRVDWIQITPRDGYALDVIEFLERRARGEDATFTRTAVVFIALASGFGATALLLLVFWVVSRQRQKKEDDSYLLGGVTSDVHQHRPFFFRGSLWVLLFVGLTVVVGLALGLNSKTCCR